MPIGVIVNASSVLLGGMFGVFFSVINFPKISKKN